MMPYITAFFMPRRKEDRPDVIVDGAVNFAFLGQFAHTPRDTVFTTEYSVRTAMEAVYGLLGVDRGVPEVWVTTQWLELLLQLLLLSKKLVNNSLKSLDFSRLFLFSLLSLSINNNLKNKGAVTSR